MALTSDLLCNEMSEQIMCFLLPALADPVNNFPFGLLVESLLESQTVQDAEGGGLHVIPTPWLLYAVLIFAENLLGMILLMKIYMYM